MKKMKRIEGEVDQNLVMDWLNFSHQDGFVRNNMFFKGTRFLLTAYEWENAGKRGKKVKVVTVRLPHDFTNKRSFGNSTYDFLFDAIRCCNTAEEVFELAKKCYAKFLVDFPGCDGWNFGNSLEEKRGIDVQNPFEEMIEIRNKHFVLQCTMLDFVIHDLSDPHNEPRLYPVRKGTDSAALYKALKKDKWMMFAAGLDDDDTVTLPQLRKLMNDNNIQYRTFFND